MTSYPIGRPMNNKKPIIIGVSIAVLVVGLLITNAVSAYPVSHPATVVDKDYRASYTTSRWVPDGNGGGYTTTDYHPETFTVIVTGEFGTESVGVRKGTYARFSEGDECTYSYQQGTFFAYGSNIK